MRSRPSLLTRALESLAGGLWVIFALVSLFVGTIWTFAIGDAELARWVLNRDLFLTLQWLLAHLDFLWITLAATSTYLCLAAREGIRTARRWGLIILLAVVAFVWISTRLGFPLGAIQYGSLLGARVASVPLGLPLFWFAVIIGAREGLLRYFPRWSHQRIALGVGLAAAFTDFSLEPLAAKSRGFWFWRSASPEFPPIFDPPLSAGIAWGVLAGVLAWTMREKSVVASARPRAWEPIATLAIFHAVFLAAHLGRWVRG